MPEEQLADEVVTAEIKQVAHHRFVFEPASFDERRIGVEVDLKKVVADNSVYLRGWDFPHLSGREESRVSSQYLVGWSDFMGHLECWRLYRSALFVHLSALREDDPDYRQKLASSLYVGGRQRPDKFLSIYDSLWLVTEAHEFLSRLAVAGFFKGGVTFSVELNNVNGRVLSFGTMERALHNIYAANEDLVSFSSVYSESKAISEPRALAIDAIRSIYLDFNGASFSDQVLTDMQHELYRVRR